MRYNKEYKELVKQSKALKKQLKVCGKLALEENFKVLFEKYPRLESFAWKQYTDYFNDGDSCDFYVHSDDCELYINGDSVEDYDEDDEEINEVAEKISASINQFDDDLLGEFFGDHVKVVVNKEGIKTESYRDHN